MKSKFLTSLVLVLAASLISGCATKQHSEELNVSTVGEKIYDTHPALRAAPGCVLARLVTVSVGRGYEFGGEAVGATLVPIEFKYPETGQPFGGGGGGGYQGRNLFSIKPVETEIGKPFYIRIFIKNSLATQYQQSIGNLMEACADENDPNHLKLNLIFSIPAGEAFDWPGEHDYSHWFVESLEIPRE